MAPLYNCVTDQLLSGEQAKPSHAARIGGGILYNDKAGYCCFICSDKGLAFC